MAGDANFPLDDSGRVYHVGLKRGEVNNRILTVGDWKRAERLSTLLDRDGDGNLKDFAKFQSGRGFTTINGRYRSVPVSIVAIGMGPPMVDFFIRETRHIIDGPMAVIRLGTCGCLSGARVGTLCVASEAVGITRNYEHFQSRPDLPPYNITTPVKGDQGLLQALEAKVKEQVGADRVVVGANATADSFYGSQGRPSPHFIDDNDQIFAVAERHPTNDPIVSLEMETHTIFHLAHCAKPLSGGQKSILAGACAIAVADRSRNEWMDVKRELPDLELKGGRAVLDVLATCSIVECYRTEYTARLVRPEAATHRAPPPEHKMPKISHTGPMDGAGVHWALPVTWKIQRTAMSTFLQFGRLSTFRFVVRTRPKEGSFWCIALCSQYAAGVASVDRFDAAALPTMGALSEVTLNDQQVALPTRRPEFVKPIRIQPSTGLNTIHLTVCGQGSGCVAVFEVKTIPISQLQSKALIAARRVEGYQSASRRPDETGQGELATTRVTMSAHDPLSLNLIKTPVRSLNCSHVSVMDLSDLLNFHSQSLTPLTCPSCSIPIGRVFVQGTPQDYVDASLRRRNHGLTNLLVDEQLLQLFQTIESEDEVSHIEYDFQHKQWELHVCTETREQDNQAGSPTKRSTFPGIPESEETDVAAPRGRKRRHVREPSCDRNNHETKNSDLGQGRAMPQEVRKSAARIKASCSSEEPPQREVCRVTARDTDTRSRLVSQVARSPPVTPSRQCTPRMTRSRARLAQSLPQRAPCTISPTHVSRPPEVAADCSLPTHQDAPEARVAPHTQSTPEADAMTQAGGVAGGSLPARQNTLVATGMHPAPEGVPAVAPDRRGHPTPTLGPRARPDEVPVFISSSGLPPQPPVPSPEVRMWVAESENGELVWIPIRAPTRTQLSPTIIDLT